MLALLRWRPRFDSTERDLEPPGRRRPDRCIELDATDVPDGRAFTHDDPVRRRRRLERIQVSGKCDRANLARHRLDIPSVVDNPLIECGTRRISEMPRCA